jgi:polysaccharide biosynthesis protein PelB
VARFTQCAPKILASIWFLIDQKRVQELPLVLRKYASRAETDASFWLAFAAGSQTLERHPEAVVWYAKEVRRTPEEPLLLLNYADALERVRSVGMSERIRRHAWLLLKHKYRHLENLQGASQSQELLALARLAILNQPGDPSLQWVRQWVNQMREGSATQADEQLKVLVLGWAIVREQFVNARSWMWLRYAQQSQTAAPLWGQSQVALQLGDTEALQQLLSHKGPELPIYNRYDTAYALGNVQQALDISFQGMSQPAGDEPLYDRFRQHVPLHANYVQVRSAVENTGALDTQGLHFETRLIPHPNLHLVLGWSQQQQSSNDAHLASLALNADRLDSIQARWLGRRGDTVLTLFRHNEWQATTGLRLQQALQWGGRVSLEAGLDVRTDSSVSVPLRIAGYENSVSASINYTLGKREYVRAAPRWTQYYTQSGDYLGSGRILDLEAGYRFRTEYPDWRVRAFVTQQQFFRDGSLSASSRDKLPAGLQSSIATGEIDPLAFFLPESSTTLGSCVSMGENLAGQNIQTLYSRAWRPFMDFCLNHNTLSGSSYTGNVGLVGSITGEDHMSLQWQNSNSTAPGGSPTQSLSMRYRHYF